MERQALLRSVKKVIHEIEPSAEVILYGSQARKESTSESDWDFLVLLDGPVDDERTNRIRHLLYEIEWEGDEVLCSVICSREEWNSPHYRAMPFHQNVEQEGIAI